MLTSIIVPVYNAEKTLEQCIFSLLELDYPKNMLEIIFVDNNSSDSTPNILKKYIERLNVLNEVKQGPAAARNKGIAQAKGDIVAFTDSDCMVEKYWLKNIAETFHKNKDIYIIGGKILSKIPFNNIEKYGEKIHDHNKAINLYKPSTVITMNMAVRKDIFKKVGLFDEEFMRGSDTDFSYRVYKAGYKFKYVPEAIIFHRNEMTLKGLFMEGFVHGFWRVKLSKKHMNYLFQFQNRFYFKDYIKLIRTVLLFILTVFINHKYAFSQLNEFIFYLGKKTGLIFGLIKFKFIII